MTRKSQYTLKPAEIKALIFHCQDLRERIMIRLMAHCGMRREEVAGILIQKIDWSRHRVSFLGKGQLTGLVPIPPDLLQDIKFFLTGRSNGFLFMAKKRNGHLTIVQINRIVADIGKRAGIHSPDPNSKTRNIHPHLLRHSFARMCKDSGMTMEEVQRLMRHASVSTTMDIYGTLDFDEVQRRYEQKFLGKMD